MHAEVLLGRLQLDLVGDIRLLQGLFSDPRKVLVQLRLSLGFQSLVQARAQLKNRESPLLGVGGRLADVHHQFEEGVGVVIYEFFQVLLAFIFEAFVVARAEEVVDQLNSGSRVQVRVRVGVLHVGSLYLNITMLVSDWVCVSGFKLSN